MGKAVTHTHMSCGHTVITESMGIQWLSSIEPMETTWVPTLKSPSSTGESAYSSRPSQIGRCPASASLCRLTWLNASNKVAHKCHLIRGSILYQRVIKFFFMRIKWAFAAARCTAARPKLKMKSKWKRFNQIIRLQKISSAANVFLMWYCAT